jgi:hypothetical protein
VRPVPGREQRSRRVDVILGKRAKLEPTHQATIAPDIDEDQTATPTGPAWPGRASSHSIAPTPKLGLDVKRPIGA